MYKAALVSLLAAGLAHADPVPFHVVDLNINTAESIKVAGKPVSVKLLDAGEKRDHVRAVIREAWVEVEINGVRAKLFCGNYQLPTQVGEFLADCAVTKAYYTDSNADAWRLQKDARLRLWPLGTPALGLRPMTYPARQLWFATQTQMANEPTFVDDAERPRPRDGSGDASRVYYHAGLDIGGAEGMVEVVAATDGLVVVRGTDSLPGHDDKLIERRYESVYTLDEYGWYYRYSHLQSIDRAIQPGARVKMGQKIGVLGKEGNSGGWSHLHFQILGPQPSGKLGTIEGYAFLWEAYLREYKPDLIAVARPHKAVLTGESVRLDGSRSWSRESKITRYEWHFTDGVDASGAVVERVYSRAGTYSEILKITDALGHIAYDFATVDVLDRGKPEQVPISIHAAYWPTTGIQPGREITFKVRTFGTTDGRETWDFGDGSTGSTRSDGNAEPMSKDGYAITSHNFRKPGDYLVRVERENRFGYKATARLHIRVEGPR